MCMANFEIAQNIVKKIEGGYQNLKNDPGNWDSGKVGVGNLIGTKYGISAPTLKMYLGRPITPEDMKNLSYETALDIYKKYYWNPMGLDIMVNQSVANLIYQTAVHFGVRGAKKIISEVVNHPYSVDYLNRLNQEKLFNDIKTKLINIYSKNPTFAKGFINRLNNFVFSL